MRSHRNIIIHLVSCDYICLEKSEISLKHIRFFFNSTFYQFCHKIIFRTEMKNTNDPLSQ